MCNMIFCFVIYQSAMLQYLFLKKLKARNNINLEVEYFTFLGCFFYGIDNCK